MASIKTLWNFASTQPGIIVCTAPFWAAITVFAQSGSGVFGFCLQTFFFLPKTWPKRIALIFAYPLFLFFWSWKYPELSLSHLPFHKAASHSSSLHFIVGDVCNFPERDAHGFSFPIQTDSGIFLAKTLQNSVAPRFGSSVLLLGKKRNPEPPTNPGQRDSRLWLRSQAASGFVSVESWKEIAPPPLWKIYLARFRLKLSQGLTNYIPAPALALVTGALLNDVEKLAASTKQDFIRSGMQHVLAISGQHISLIVAVLVLLGMALRLPQKWAFLLAAGITFLYIPLVGSPASVVRAGIMLACLLPGMVLEKPTTGLNTICLSLTFDLCLSPYGILDLGLQLSYAATLALILGASPGQKVAQYFASIPGMGVALQMVFMSILVTLFTFPILALSTNAIAPWGILGNLITVPISSVILLAGLGVWFLSPIPLLATWAGACAGFSSLLLEGCVHYLARLPGAIWSICTPSTPVVWIFILGVVSIIVALKAQAWKLGGLFIIALLCIEISRASWIRFFTEGTKMSFLAVGHGDAAVLELPGALYLMDAGPGEREAMQIILPYLRSHGYQTIDALILTHPDQDHFGGAFSLLENIPIRVILAPPIGPEAQPSWNCLKALAHRKGVPWKEVQAGDKLYQKGEQEALWVLSPAPISASLSDNDRSVVCLFTASNTKVFFTGDVEGPGQMALASTWPLWRGAWMKAPHHGSDRTTLPCFLKAASSPQVVISSGKRLGFPGKVTVETLSTLGAKIGVTAQDGALVWKNVN